MGNSLETIYIVPLMGSTAELPQLAPPLLPGNWIVPRVLGGVNKPSLRDSRSKSRIQVLSSSDRYGLISFSVKDCRANGGGALGKGCVGDVCSPGTSLCGTGFSCIGHSGSPVTRSKTNRNPC